MENWIVSYETAIRLSFFLGILITMMLLESVLPRRKSQTSLPLSQRMIRWSNNLSLAFIASILTRILLPISLVSFSFYCQTSALGLFNQDFSSSISPLFIFIISLILFDLVIYWQHRIFHHIPILWRLHKVHHSDETFDVTTGIRFHPFEILLSIIIKFAVIALLGLTAESIIAFEVILNALALFNHSNVKIPSSIDYYLRKFIVTPDMHRVHHSQILNETHSNFGFNISLWDRIFDSYRDQPSLGHHDMNIGLPEFNDSEEPRHLTRLLIMPFRAHNKK